MEVEECRKVSWVVYQVDGAEAKGEAYLSLGNMAGFITDRNA